MLKEKNTQLKDRLSKILDEIGRTSKYADAIKQDINSEFKSRNLNATRASLVMFGNLDLNTLSNSDDDIKFLFLLTYSLNKSLEGKESIRIDVEDYFTKLEVQQWKDYKEVVIQENIFPLVFEDVTRLNDKIWQFPLTAQQLNKLSVANIILYNFKTQRNPRITVSGEKINMDTKKVFEIKERLLNDEQFPDQIRLNVLNTGEERPIYNAKNRTLTLNEGCVIDIFDGWHRKTSNDLALEVNPDLNFTWSIMMTYFSEKQAHDFMVQIDKQKKIKTEYIQQMDYNKPENLIIDTIIDDKLSELAKVMKDDDAYIRLNRALTKKSIVAQAIEENYKEQLSTSTNIRSISRWIAEFTDYLMGLYIDEFINKPYEIKGYSVINHKNMFYGYIALAAALQDNKNWKDILKQKMESIDFNADNPIWRNVGINNNKDANKTTRNKLYQIFKEGISNE